MASSFVSSQIGIKPDQPLESINSDLASIAKQLRVERALAT